ncbi:hypothetical protein SS50377_20246 [Spironucleus salmonicida]|uniref:Uncharacterized protein n=1 Tax=Spironucleus salmonicida TaxID=348837 RepID=V6LKZ3_9EUKA|nr:hypothetical protein SS50377_20246 [Spironucleus salmonicida]|eukprot:EST45300.1 Hypothetical protein SS50377_14877 [Spironucleus salmonicida]
MENIEIFLAQLHEQAQTLSFQLNQQIQLNDTYKQENQLLSRQVKDLNSRLTLQTKELEDFEKKDLEQNKLISDLINSVKTKTQQTKSSKIDHEMQLSTAKTSAAENQVLMFKIDELEKEVKRLSKFELLTQKFKAASADLGIQFQQVQNVVRDLRKQNSELQQQLYNLSQVAIPGNKQTSQINYDDELDFKKPKKPKNSQKQAQNFIQQQDVEENPQINMQSEYFKEDFFNIDDSEFHSIRINKSTREDHDNNDENYDNNDEMLVLSSGMLQDEYNYLTKE